MRVYNILCTRGAVFTARDKSFPFILFFPLARRGAHYNTLTLYVVCESAAETMPRKKSMPALRRGVWEDPKLLQLRTTFVKTRHALVYE